MNKMVTRTLLCHEPSQGWGLLEERGPNGELLARHVHGPNIDDLVLSELNGAVYYYHHDHLNSTIAVTDENGHVVEQYRYDVYGQPFFYGPDGARRGESALGIRFLFTGREWRSSLALYDYRHRVYSPSLGRFQQMDPLGFAGGDMNLYRYVGNHVLILRDPRGQ
jgi:RHS repeat-associated protein